ncbi:DMT family transporter [Acinetobacter sp. MD2(2019)]|uniref:DMT family transporter n=1 Tax=Acinetobacter sp. MD2(2019) TaxID=2605273 RepID=UPI002D1F2AF1|nr:DMT family transporter [Acinetobacter sp. MD2(2019)]MEB3754213.1 EamA family transporter [Acinetobacter sp. MD2(2019)]
MNLRVISAITLLCLIWGSLWGMVKHSLHIFPPFLFISTRLILSGLTLMLLQRMLGKSIWPERNEWQRLMILSFLICFGFYATQTFAMQFVGSGLSAVLVFTMPIFIGVLAHYILNERLTRQKMVGLVCGGIGLIAILWPQLHQLGINKSLIGQMMLIGSGLFWALSTIYIKKHFAQYDKIKLTLWQFLLGGIALFITALCFEKVDDQVWLNSSNLLWLAYIAIIGTGFTFALWNWIVAQVDTFIASISIMCVPILSLVFSALLWHETLTKNILVGACFIILGILMSSLKIKPKPAVIHCASLK